MTCQALCVVMACRNSAPRTGRSDCCSASPLEAAGREKNAPLAFTGMTRMRQKPLLRPYPDRTAICLQ